MPGVAIKDKWVRLPVTQGPPSTEYAYLVMNCCELVDVIKNALFLHTMGSTVKLATSLISFTVSVYVLIHVPLVTVSVTGNIPYPGNVCVGFSWVEVAPFPNCHR